MTKTLTEYQLQKAIFEFVSWQRISNPLYQYVVAIPNGAHLAHGARSFNALKATGFSNGLPDIACFLPATYGQVPYHGLFIEQKRVGGKLSQYQKDWLVRLKEAGYKAVVSYHSNETIELLVDWMQHVTIDRVIIAKESAKDN